VYDAEEGNRCALFDGKTLKGWIQRGGQARYEAKDRMIVGTTVAGAPNSFLCTEKTYGDFVLDLEFNVDAGLNSGVQIRSGTLKDDRGERVQGYQVEIDPSERAWSGGIYDEAGRGWLRDLRDNEPARKALKPGEWNRFHIEAVGDIIRTWINGVPAAVLQDDKTASGFIALQVHSTKSKKPLQVRWRKIRLQELDSSCVEAEAADAFMGDWMGVRGEGATGVVAQVIAMGEGKYQANLLPRFDERVAPLVVMNGVASQGGVDFKGGEWWGRITEGMFTGGRQGAGTPSFMLAKTWRVSPTLGVAPPPGAIVLLDGSSLDSWRRVQPNPGLLNLGKHLGGDHRVAYLRTQVWSPRRQKAVLEIGSDDGVKVWLRDALVHSKNTVRGVKPGEDKIKVKLGRGWNPLMLKVTQGRGGWGACARFCAVDGKALEGLRVARDPAALGETPQALSLEKTKGFLQVWDVAGPYFEVGKEGAALFDVAFPPERKGGEVVPWQAFPVDPDPDKARWKILADGAMEVAAQSGSIASRKTFADHQIHLEFRTPFLPEKRGQGRGNSGVYLQGRYEVQVLDSYGLEGRDNECGGIYKVAAPQVNRCAPPLQWQTYDITFYAPRFDTNGRKIKNAHMTVIHNGRPIHENLELPGPTGGALTSGEPPEPGPLFLQDHGNTVQYRNIWIIDLTAPGRMD